jgi:cold shock CspA family protein
MQKPPEITFKDTEPSQLLEQIIHERIERLQRFHPRLIGCRVAVSVPHRSPVDGNRAPIAIALEIEVPGRNMIVVKDSERPGERDGDRIPVVNRVFDIAHRRLEATDEMRRNEFRGREVTAREGTAEAGIVVQLFPEQSYGFVEVEGSPELYFTRNAVVDGRFDELEVGTLVQVTRATTEGPMGPQASSVRVTNLRRSAP